MSDNENQIHVPESFLALFTRPGGYRLTEPMAVVRERYELCEDLANMLVEQASARLNDRGASEREVLAGMRGALSVEGSPVTATEAHWVGCRLAELLGWEMPEPPAAQD